MAASPEPRRARWERRVRTIPIMLGATTLGLVAVPVALPVLAVADLVRGRVRLPRARMYLFLLQYGVNDSVEILLAPVLWLMAGGGTRLHGAASIARHRRLQEWSVAVLARRAASLLGVRLEVDPTAAAALEPGPAIVVCRHVSLLDASLPGLLYQQRGYAAYGVIMAELLADPGFDLLYGRLGSVFIPRDDGPAARAAVADLGSRLDDRSVAVIFPEGRLFRPEVRDHLLGRLAVKDPARSAGLAGLTHVLPVRPGGVGVLLDAVPTADVVVIAHAGLDRYPTVKDLVRAVPLREPVRVTAWRVARPDVPDDPGTRVLWLDGQWRRVDRWVDDHLPA